VVRRRTHFRCRGAAVQPPRMAPADPQAVHAGPARRGVVRRGPGELRKICRTTSARRTSSLARRSPALAWHRDAEGRALWLENGRLVREEGLSHAGPPGLGDPWYEAIPGGWRGSSLRGHGRGRLTGSSQFLMDGRQGPRGRTSTRPTGCPTTWSSPDTSCAACRPDAARRGTSARPDAHGRPHGDDDPRGERALGSRSGACRTTARPRWSAQTGSTSCLLLGSPHARPRRFRRAHQPFVAQGAAPGPARRPQRPPGVWPLAQKPGPEPCSLRCSTRVATPVRDRALRRRSGHLRRERRPSCCSSTASVSCA
jgi:hypothetical protein